MKKIYSALLSIGLLTTTPLISGPGKGHSHAPIKTEGAKKQAEKIVAKLIEKGKIDKSWEKQKINEPYKKDYGKGPEWVVTVDNPTVKDKKKSKLYIFLSLDGHVLGTNFTGN